MKKFLTLMFLAVFSVSAFAAEDMDDEIQDSFPASQSHVVTSVQTCYDQLDPAEALEIQKKSLKPYEECLNKISEKIQKQKTATARKIAEDEADAAEDAKPETPRNYVRVMNKAPAGKKKTAADADSGKDAKDSAGTKKKSEKDFENK